MKVVASGGWRESGRWWKEEGGRKQQMRTEIETEEHESLERKPSRQALLPYPSYRHFIK